MADREVRPEADSPEGNDRKKSKDKGNSGFSYGMKEKQRLKQIPFRNDRKKSNGGFSGDGVEAVTQGTVVVFGGTVYLVIRVLLGFKCIWFGLGWRRFCMRWRV